MRVKTQQLHGSGKRRYLVPMREDMTIRHFQTTWLCSCCRLHFCAVTVPHKYSRTFHCRNAYVYGTVYSTTSLYYITSCMCTIFMFLHTCSVRLTLQWVYRDCAVLCCLLKEALLDELVISCRLTIIGMMITTIGPVPYVLNSVRAQPRFLDGKLGQALQHSLHGTTDTP